MTGYVVRPAAEADLDAIAQFEIDIARVSFADEAITDPALHRRRVTGSLGKQGEITLVAVPDGDPAEVVGWAWLSPSSRVCARCCTERSAGTNGSESGRDGPAGTGG